ncbi:MAG TPA: PHP domain-containing protein [Steroidobacteraceae bacterium]|nr:PHP domain-containing protein [Steroidobacteraceae bacterium]
MNVDLHLHSTCSDGLLGPAAVVDLAADAGVEMLALTDHDTVAGALEARAQCERRGLRSITGVEVSAAWNGQTLHIIGLDIDLETPALLAGLATVRDLRRERMREIARRLERKSIPAPALVAEIEAAHDVVTRTHLARALVARRLVESPQHAFKRLLGRGRPGHVQAHYPDIATVVGWIRSARGIAVLAHPLRYALSSGGRRRLLDEFRGCGGVAIEVVCGSAQGEIEPLATLAQRFGFAGSVGSDFHDPQMRWNPPGRLAKLPAQVEPVWLRFQ